MRKSILRRTIYASVVVLTLFFATVFSLEQEPHEYSLQKRRDDVPETVLEPPGDIFQIAHPASTSGLSALSLLSPFI